MTKDEWLSIGLQNGLIDLEEHELIAFGNAYVAWFRTKCNINRGSTMDRIENTYNRYFLGSDFIDKCTSNITEKDIVQFINRCIAVNGSLSKKEFERIYQILHSVLVYVRDMGYVGSKLYDWEVIKRNVPQNKILSQSKTENALSKDTVNHIIHKVVFENVYPLKRSASLLLCMNFYLGLRIGELSALMFTDFDLDRRVLKICRTDSKHYERDENGERTKLCYDTGETKTPYSIREIPLVNEAVYIYELIKKHHEEKAYNSLFLCYDGADTIRVRSLDRTLRRLSTLCSTPHYNSHLIRKTFASMLHHANVPTRVISDLMGHSEISTTERNYILSFKDTNSLYYGYMKDGLIYN